MAEVCQRGLTPSKTRIFFGSFGRLRRKNVARSRRNLESASQDRGSESGVSLLITLLFVGLIASLLTQFVIQENVISTRSSAAAAGWQLTEVARAARVYVRNNSFNVTGAPVPVVTNGLQDNIPDNTFDKNNLVSAGPPFVPAPIEIEIQDLEDAGLLPENFARGPGPTTRNAFRQTIRVYAANFPLDGDPADPATVATAYVFLDNNGRGSASLNARIAEQAQKFGMPISAPLLNGAGANISDACGATPAASAWDTNCLTEAQFAAVTGQAFAAGMLMAPAWKAYQHDPRTIARFPQPENLGAGTMLTNLNMGRLDLDAANACQNEVHIWNGENNHIALSYDDTGICAAQDDVVAGGTVDNRFDILNIPSMNVQTAVLQAQREDFFDNLAPITGSIYDTSGTAGDRSSGTDDNVMMDEGDPTRDNSVQSLAILAAPQLNQVLTLEGTVRTSTLSLVARASNDAATGAPLYDQGGVPAEFINTTGTTGLATEDYLGTFHVNGNLNVDNGVSLDHDNGAGQLDMQVTGTIDTDVAYIQGNVLNNAPGTSNLTVTEFLTADTVNTFNNLGTLTQVGDDSAPSGNLVNQGIIADEFTANTAASDIVATETFDVVGQAIFNEVDLIVDANADTGAYPVSATDTPYVIVGATTASAGVDVTNLTIGGGDSADQGNLIVGGDIDIAGPTILQACSSAGGGTGGCPDITLDPILN